MADGCILPILEEASVKEIREMSYVLPKFNEMTEDLDEFDRSEDARVAIRELAEFLSYEDLLEIASDLAEKVNDFWL